MGNIDADLAESGDRFPVAADLLAWMRREAGVVRGVLEGSRAFRGVRAVPIHDDLWKDNILAEPSGAWTVIDWDGIRLGDPVLDYAVLLWPLLREGAEASRWLPRDPGLDERLRLCLRAALLEEVIDPLADWVEATRMPEHLDVVRPEKLRVHGAALEDYRHRYAR
jgi:aminoglycoside phosphotransferase (APT) family kinase protein